MTDKVVTVCTGYSQEQFPDAKSWSVGDDKCLVLWNNDAEAIALFTPESWRSVRYAEREKTADEIAAECQWILRTARMPEEFTHVVVLTSDKKQDFCYWDGYAEWKVVHEARQYKLTDIAYWLPLPPVPVFE